MSWRTTRASIAAIERHCGSNDPRLPELRRRLVDERREQAIAELIGRLLADGPSLTAAQRERLANLLASPARQAS